MKDAESRPVEGESPASRCSSTICGTTPGVWSSVHEEHPELVEHYTAFLEKQWEAHQALATRFTRPVVRSVAYARAARDAPRSGLYPVGVVISGRERRGFDRGRD